MIKRMYKEFKQLVLETFGYSIYSFEYDKRHYTFTFKEALEWSKCYSDMDLIHINRFGAIVATRGCFSTLESL